MGRTRSPSRTSHVLTASALSILLTYVPLTPAPLHPTHAPCLWLAHPSVYCVPFSPLTCVCVCVRIQIELSQVVFLFSHLFTTSNNRGSMFTGAAIALQEALLLAVLVATRARMREKQLQRRPSVTPSKKLRFKRRVFLWLSKGMFLNS